MFMLQNNFEEFYPMLKGLRNCSIFHWLRSC